MTFLTDFADQAVLLPVVAVVALVLALLRRRRAALAWLGAIGATFGLVLVLKLGFLACGPAFQPFGLRSPSGHTAAAAVVAGGLTVLLTGRRMVAVPVAVVAAMAIGASRVVLGFHSVPEVLVAAVLGCAGAIGLSWVMGPSPVSRRPVALLAAAGLVAVLLHGARLPAEAAIWALSDGALDFMQACRGGKPEPL